MQYRAINTSESKYLITIDEHFWTVSLLQQRESGPARLLGLANGLRSSLLSEEETLNNLLSLYSIREYAN